MSHLQDQLRQDFTRMVRGWYHITGRRTINAGLAIHRCGSLVKYITAIVNKEPTEMWWLAKRLDRRDLTYEHLVRKYRMLFDMKTRAIAQERTYDIFRTT